MLITVREKIINMFQSHTQWDRGDFEDVLNEFIKDLQDKKESLIFGYNIRGPEEVPYAVNKIIDEIILMVGKED